MIKGDLIPDITLMDENDQPVGLKSIAKETALVVYFYPKDETPGCTAEACSFRDHFNEFTENNVKVFGISRDSSTSHRSFIRRHQLNFSLLTDNQGKAETIFGIKRTLLGLLPGRETFVFAKGGKLIHKVDSAINMQKHVTESLAAIRNFQA